MAAGDAGRRKNKILGDQWIPVSRAMNSCPAWFALAGSPSALRVLSRIQEEHMAHGGYENGKLPVTYENFETWGIRRDSIAGAIRELVALGFIEVTRRGYNGTAEKRTPSLYRLTFLPTWNASKVALSGTHEYLRIKTVKEALALGKAARNAAENRNVQRGKRSKMQPEILHTKCILPPHSVSAGHPTA